MVSPATATNLAQSEALFARLRQIYAPSELLIEAAQIQPYDSDAPTGVFTSRRFVEFLTIPAYEDL